MTPTTSTSRLQHRGEDYWSGVKTTVAEALSDAFEVLACADGESHELAMSVYMSRMAERHVTVDAAQDALRFLEGEGVVKFTAIGNIQTAA